MSPAAAPYRSEEKETSSESMLVSSETPPKELPITPELKDAFLSSLKAYGLSLRFFSGSWNTYPVSRTGGKYDMVLTSETIYRTTSLPSLVRLLQGACGRTEEPECLSLEHPDSATQAGPSLTYLCLVAAKVLACLLLRLLQPRLRAL